MDNTAQETQNPPENVSVNAQSSSIEQTQSSYNNGENIQNYSEITQNIDNNNENSPKLTDTNSEQNSEYQRGYQNETEITQNNVNNENVNQNSGRHQAEVHTTVNWELVFVEPPSYNVFVGDLTPDATENDLRERFQACGEIQAINIMKESRTNTCKGYAFIHFLTPEGQQKALAPEFNGSLIRGRPCRVKLSEHKTDLFLGNIPMDLDEEQILDAVKRLCGNLTDQIKIELKRGPPPAKKSRGFCFARFPTHPTAEACKKILTASTISGRLLNVAWAETTVHREVDSETMSKVTTLYVSNLYTTVTEETLRTLFSQFGEVVKSVIVRNPYTSEPRGFAFIQYKDRAACEYALSVLHDTVFAGQTISVVLAKPPPDGSPIRKGKGTTTVVQGWRGSRTSQPGRYSIRGRGGRGGRTSHGGNVGLSSYQAWDSNYTNSSWAQPQQAYAPFTAMGAYGQMGYNTNPYQNFTNPAGAFANFGYFNTPNALSNYTYGQY